MEISHNRHITLSKVAQQELLRDICGRPSTEACGVLLGYRDQIDNWYVEKAVPLPNLFDSPVYFEFAPEDLLYRFAFRGTNSIWAVSPCCTSLEICLSERELVLAVELSYPGQTVGVYHSHPTGFAHTNSRSERQISNEVQQGETAQMEFVPRNANRYQASQTDRKNMERINQEQHIPWIWLIIRGPFNNAFAEQAKGAIPPHSIIAYHHYEETGLQRIALVIG